MSNAVKFTNEGKVEFGYGVKEDMIEFHISDTGIGHGDRTPSKHFQAVLPG